MKKFFRDIGILLAFCGAFYLLTVMVNRLDGDSESDPSDFSPARKRANALLEKKDWSAARFEFKKLTEQDPFNGYAWSGYSNCLWGILQVELDRREFLNRSNAQDTEEAIEVERKIAELNGQNRDVLLQVKKFARYRSTALLRLAVLECVKGDHDEALDYLEEFVGRGYQTKLGLRWIDSFGSSDSGSQDANLVGPSPGLIPRYRLPLMPPPETSNSRFEYKGDLSELRVPTGTETGLHQEPRFWDLVRREGTSVEF